MTAVRVALWTDFDGAEQSAVPGSALPGSAVVIGIPGASEPAEVWPDGLGEEVARLGGRLVRFDLLDQGRSPWLATPYDFAALVGPVTALIERVVAQSSRSSSRAGVIVMGHGFGGTLGLQIAATRPELVRHLVMVGSTGWYLDPTLYGPDEAVVVGMIWRRRLGTGTTDLARALTNELRLTYSEDDRPPLAALQAEAERWLAWGFNPHDEHRSAWLGAPSLWAAAKSLGCPTTVIHGARDPVLPVMHSERLAALIPGARLNIVPGAGHALSAPMRDQLLRVLRDLIEPDTTD